MSRFASTAQPTPLAHYEGHSLLPAPQAMLKGALESEFEISVIAGPIHGMNREGWEAMGDVPILEPAAAEILRQHSTRLVATPDAARALALAFHAARSGNAGLALVPNGELDQVVESLSRMADTVLERGAMCVILEDSPEQAPATCPRRAAQRLNLPCIEPADVGQWRDAIENALRLSRAGRCPSCIVVHTSILRSSDTLEMRPNRVHGSVEALVARRRRPRFRLAPVAADARADRAAADSLDRSIEMRVGPLRAARRLELNSFRAVPSPGERVAIGFITVGPADCSLLHITHALGLHGRVPVLQLGLIHPIDDSAVGRLLTRCQRVIVLEPRRGSLEPAVIAVAETMRHRGEQPATVWNLLNIVDQEKPPTGERPATDQVRSHMSLPAPAHVNDNLHPSVLVRKISHLLHSVRPTAQVAQHLVPDPPIPSIKMPPRKSNAGVDAALAAVRRVLADVDQWLREHSFTDAEDSPHDKPSALAIEGAPLSNFTGRIVNVEMWEHSRFQQEGLLALTYAARENRPSIFIVCEVASGEIHDLERLARGAVPADAADRVSLQTANLNDLPALRDLLRQAALSNQMTVVILRDGPPPRFDVAAIEQSLVEIDRLGFEPRQKLLRSVHDLCRLQPGSDQDVEIAPSDSETADRNDSSEELGTLRVVESSHAPELKTTFGMESVAGREGPAIRIRVKPLLEEVEVIRTRPPAATFGRGSRHASKLPVPQPVHARQGQWRVHLAGFRGHAPGAATRVLCEAGRIMGYHVRAIHDPTPIGGGLRAWSQVLFTHPPQGQSPVPLTATIPFGEADLLVGLDPQETIRAIGGDAMLRVAHADRTYVVANVLRSHSSQILAPGFANQTAESPPVAADPSIAPLLAVTRSDCRLVENFSGACRAWFHTDRVADMTMLGAAYQCGLIPVSLEAIETALARAQGLGFGRAWETFEFGRRLAADRELFIPPKAANVDDAHRISRRVVLSLSRGGWGGGERARNFSQLIQHSLLAMPGLAETDQGRAAQAIFVAACHRCRIWGGFAYAQQYADLVVRLYRADRGDTGRALTRHAILPLAEVMLIRDHLYIAGVATSAEQRRRLRQRLNVKLARGDVIERRYLTRFELFAFGRRYRADVRTSDWPARAASAFRRAVPVRLRGSRRERELRDYIMAFLNRAVASANADYDHWREAVQRLHDQAAVDRLRDMAMAELKMLIESRSGSPATSSASSAESVLASLDG